MRAPLSEEVEFFRVTEGGKVHVFECRELSPSIDILDLNPTEAFATNLFLGRHKARCGVSVTWHRALGTDTFADDDICWHCVKATSEAEQPRLFEHPTK